VGPQAAGETWLPELPDLHPLPGDDDVLGVKDVDQRSQSVAELLPGPVEQVTTGEGIVADQRLQTACEATVAQFTVWLDDDVAKLAGASVRAAVDMAVEGEGTKDDLNAAARAAHAGAAALNAARKRHAG